jgi:hypothetical protein
MDKPVEARKELLLKMYDQMFQDINRHILVVWQAIGVVIGAFATFAVIDKLGLPFDVAVALVVLLCGWMLAQLYDSAYWYNRNLVIIANIEKQFLDTDDLRNIHYYFGSHRRRNKMIAHLRIQRFLGSGVALLVLAYHFYRARIWAGFGEPFDHINWFKAMPYVAVFVAFLFVNQVRNDRVEAYEEFLEKSPGKDIGGGEENSPGHAVNRSIWRKCWLMIRFYKRGRKPTQAVPAAEGHERCV